MGQRPEGCGSGTTARPKPRAGPAPETASARAGDRGGGAVKLWWGRLARRLALEWHLPVRPGYRRRCRAGAVREARPVSAVRPPVAHRGTRQRSYEKHERPPASSQRTHNKLATTHRAQDQHQPPTTQCPCVRHSAMPEPTAPALHARSPCPLHARSTFGRARAARSPVDARPF